MPIQQSPEHFDQAADITTKTKEASPISPVIACFMVVTLGSSEPT